MQIAFSLAALVLTGVALFYAALQDAKTMCIPNRVHLFLIAAGFLRLAAVGFSFQSVLFAVSGLLAGAVPLLLLGVFSKAVGGGDIKLAGSTGFFLGGILSYIVLMAALILFIFFGGRRIKQKVQFGPYYAATGIAGAAIITILTLWR